MMKDETA
jgi:hypothetical protein